MTRCLHYYDAVGWVTGKSSST